MQLRTIWVRRYDENRAQDKRIVDVSDRLGPAKHGCVSSTEKLTAAERRQDLFLFDILISRRRGAR